MAPQTIGLEEINNFWYLFKYYTELKYCMTPRITGLGEINYLWHKFNY